LVETVTGNSIFAAITFYNYPGAKGEESIEQLREIYRKVEERDESNLTIETAFNAAIRQLEGVDTLTDGLVIFVFRGDDKTTTFNITPKGVMLKSKIKNNPNLKFYEGDKVGPKKAANHLGRVFNISPLEQAITEALIPYQQIDESERSRALEKFFSEDPKDSKNRKFGLQATWQAIEASVMETILVSSFFKCMYQESELDASGFVALIQEKGGQPKVHIIDDPRFVEYGLGGTAYYDFPEYEDAVPISAILAEQPPPPPIRNSRRKKKKSGR